VKWYIKPPFDGIFAQQYLYQKLLESDNYFWNYHWWLDGIFFYWDTVQIQDVGLFNCIQIFPTFLPVFTMHKYHRLRPMTIACYANSSMNIHENQNMDIYNAVAGRRWWRWLVCVILEANKTLQQLCTALVNLTTQYLIAIPAQCTLHTLVCNVTAALGCALVFFTVHNAHFTH